MRERTGRLFLSSQPLITHWVQSLVLPAGANGILGSSSEKSALIRLLSEEARHWVRAGKLSTLPLLDRGRVLSCSSWTRQKNTVLGRVAEGQISKVSLSWECSSFYSVGLLITFNCASYTDRVKTRNLNYLVWRKLRYTLDGVIAPVRITVLHVCIIFDAHAGAGIFHIRTCLRDTHAFMSLSCKFQKNNIKTSQCVKPWKRLIFWL